jgi:hypothetical protein
MGKILHLLTKFSKKEKGFSLLVSRVQTPKTQKATNMNDLNSLLMKGVRLHEKYNNIEHKIYII